MKRLFLSLILCLSAISPAADFQGLGAGTIANDISADGSVVVGSGRWTQSGGWQDIGGIANACSADGSVVVGYRKYTDFFGSIVKMPIYWTAAEGTVDIPRHRGNNSQATDVSDDGTVIVGHTNYVSNLMSFYKEAFLYNRGESSTIGLGDIDVLPEGDLEDINSAAYAISGDGSIVAGSGIPELTNIYRAMYWTEATGMVDIGVSAGLPNHSQITGISHDGTVMIGQSGIFPFMDGSAIYWTEQIGMQELGEIEGFSMQSCSLGITDDLSTIVGWATDGYGDFAAFLWKESLGMVNLQEYLQAAYSFNLDGWTLTEATSISVDGLTIVGNGINPDGFEEAWMATIPEPASILLLGLGALGIFKRVN